MDSLEKRLMEVAWNTGQKIMCDVSGRMSHKPSTVMQGHIANAFRALLKQVRDDALEEAAGVCEARGERLSDSDDYWGPTYANRIRALKEQNNG